MPATVSPTWNPVSVFFPSAQQLLVGEGDAAVFDAFYDRPNIHPHFKPFPRMVNPRNGNGVNGQQGNNAAANVGKRSKGFQVGDPRINYVAGR